MAVLSLERRTAGRRDHLYVFARRKPDVPSLCPVNAIRHRLEHRICRLPGIGDYLDHHRGKQNSSDHRRRWRPLRQRGGLCRESSRRRHHGHHLHGGGQSCKFKDAIQCILRR